MVSRTVKVCFHACVRFCIQTHTVKNFFFNQYLSSTITIRGSPLGDPLSVWTKALLSKMQAGSYLRDAGSPWLFPIFRLAERWCCICQIHGVARFLHEKPFSSLSGNVPGSPLYGRADLLRGTVLISFGRFFCSVCGFVCTCASFVFAICTQEQDSLSR